jgi:hypothetical protein
MPAAERPWKGMRRCLWFNGTPEALTTVQIVGAQMMIIRLGGFF